MINAIDKQSPDIAQGVNTAFEARTDPGDDDPCDLAGAGDQGMMFGYASRETDELKTAAYGHFGREDHDFTWERTDKAAALADAAGLGKPLVAEVLA